MMPILEQSASASSIAWVVMMTCCAIMQSKAWTPYLCLTARFFACCEIKSHMNLEAIVGKLKHIMIAALLVRYRLLCASMPVDGSSR